MTESEFLAWLDGYLEGKKTLSEKSIKIIQTKAKAAYKGVTLPAPAPYPYPYVPTYPYWRTWTTTGGITTSSGTAITSTSKPTSDTACVIASNAVSYSS